MVSLLIKGRMAVLSAAHIEPATSKVGSQQGQELLVIVDQ